VAPVEKEAFARVLAEALRDSKERSARGAAARALIESKFSWTESSRQLIELYRGLIAKTQPDSINYAPARPFSFEETRR
jgi:glycosyltransferase involved in cell wall biosynthesis